MLAILHKRDWNEDNMKILIEAMHGMGDVVCMLPMMREVRTAFPSSKITVLINKSITKDVLLCSGIKIDSIRIIDAHKKKKDALRQCLELRQEKFDLAVASANTPVKKSKLIMSLINAKLTIGIQYLLGKNLVQLNDQYHFVEAHLMAIDQLGLSLHNYFPSLNAKSEDIDRVKNTYQISDNITIIGVCVGRGDITYTDIRRKKTVYTRGWGELEQHVQNMSNLISKLLNEKWTVIMLGGVAEDDIKNKIVQRLGPYERLIDSVGKTTISESIAISKLCSVVVGVDTGMQHVADAVGRPTVSIFGPTNPLTHGAFSNRAHFIQNKQACAYCFGSNNYSSCKDRKCMKSIQVEDVFNEVKLVVQKGNVLRNV